MRDIERKNFNYLRCNSAIASIWIGQAINRREIIHVACQNCCSLLGIL